MATCLWRVSKKFKSVKCYGSTSVSKTEGRGSTPCTDAKFIAGINLWKVSKRCASRKQHYWTYQIGKRKYYEYTYKYDHFNNLYIRDDVFVVARSWYDLKPRTGVHTSFFLFCIFFTFLYPSESNQCNEKKVDHLIDLRCKKRKLRTVHDRLLDDLLELNLRKTKLKYDETLAAYYRTYNTRNRLRMSDVD